jgi:L-rhamnose isomerase/sugar isomerase
MRSSARSDFKPAYMLDQSHNVTDPIESLMNSANEVQRAYAQALLVDRKALAGYQQDNDALHRPSAEARLPHRRRARSWRWPAVRAGGAIDPVATYRASGYRSSSGIV